MRVMRICAAALLAAGSSHIAHAIDPNRTVSQYVVQQWGVENGFPRGPVYAIDQTTDGYLWIGTEAGLVRFDGLSFRLIQSARPTQLEQSLGQALGVTAGDSGDLWIRLRGLNLLRYRDDRFFEAPPDLNEEGAATTVAIRA